MWVMAVEAMFIMTRNLLQSLIPIQRWVEAVNWCEEKEGILQQ